MKKLYWRPSGASRVALILIALVSLGCLGMVQGLPSKSRQKHHSQKLAAATLARNAMRVIKDEKLNRGILVDSEADPTGTGMIGVSVSATTSNTGYLDAKQLSTNPNFAAVVVHLLKLAGAEPGDTVAVGMSGSFPALNISTLAAIKTLKLEPIVISSVASSGWGANDPGFGWLDMEETLTKSQLLSFRSVASSRGGIDDRGLGISREGRAMLDESMLHHNITRIEPKSLKESIDRRMETYREQAAGRPIKAYINVGGGAASVGTHVGKKLFKPGLNRQPPLGGTDSVMLRFVSDGVPVIHLSNIRTIAERHKLEPPTSQPFSIGQGAVYVKEEPDLRLVFFAIVLILGSLVAFLKLDLSVRLFQPRSKGSSAPQPQEMV